MMVPNGRVTHQMQGRLRLRIGDKRRDEMYFARLKNTLAQCEGVDSVSVNPLAGSVLVVGPASPDDVIRFGQKAELFQIADERLTPFSDHVSNQIDRFDVRLRAATNGQLDVTGAATISLLAAGLWQISRRRVLPEALTILWYAASIIAKPLSPVRFQR